MAETTAYFNADVVIIGGGIAGLATAYYLSQKQHLQIILLEKDSIPNPNNSSYGDERMYRRMYSNEYLSELQEESLKEWEMLEAQHDCQLLRQNGLLFYGEAWDEETIEGSIPGARRVMEKKGIPFEALNAEQLQERWPMRPKPDFIGLFESTSGMVWSARAIEVFRSQAEANGVSIHTGEETVSLNCTPSSTVEIKTRSGNTFLANQVVLTAGPWTNDLLSSFTTPLNLEIWPMLWGHYQVEETLRDRFPQWFCFQQEKPDSNDGGLYYGFPCHTPETSLIKVGIDWCPPELRTKTMSTFVREPDSELAQLLDRFLRHNWDGIKECVGLYFSPYTMTKDTLFVLDKLPGYPQISLFTGGSGQAFKFTPLLGKLLAELVLDQTPSFDLSPLSASRECVISSPDEQL
ncbi:MAG: FAD-dependent oxidoreductase [Okeania sp. SIO2G4]|uniref:FAD-dependent oxidoreductase n=1 Tax=unclassified Okeania TaxID=2634635 RepID=UPI0013BA573D|nr:MULTISPECIES: FAD-dependent oxidoreductase [unclassified Okeania]NEP05335.1 FAD-dependent oxidoreductase [Okeania sp. SIO4D6]NEP75382.1 FAD-dependent oxidoreductase [Okeania sp. SIO2G5]NEP96478.1 FAD-dependent oxidoreductase [Okeania sp. SIO2F5]NEQ94222.1 FAD-dependent oxidoreductase [Okeania sp. SIO2G4]